MRRLTVEVSEDTPHAAYLEVMGWGTLCVCLLQAFGIVDCSIRLRALRGPYNAGMRHGHE